MKELTQMRDHFLVMSVGKLLDGRTIYVITSIFIQRKNLTNVKSVVKDSVSPAP